MRPASAQVDAAAGRYRGRWSRTTRCSRVCCPACWWRPRSSPPGGCSSAPAIRRRCRSRRRACWMPPPASARCCCRPRSWARRTTRAPSSTRATTSLEIRKGQSPAATRIIAHTWKAGARAGWSQVHGSITVLSRAELFTGSGLNAVSAGFERQMIHAYHGKPATAPGPLPGQHGWLLQGTTVSTDLLHALPAPPPGRGLRLAARRRAGDRGRDRPAPRRRAAGGDHTRKRAGPEHRVRHPRLTASPPPPARAISITSAAHWRLRTSTRSVRRPSVAGKADSSARARSDSPGGSPSSSIVATR